MPGFTKLFSSILASSIWCEANETRLVWITMLAMADRNGLVEAAIPGLANAARVSLEACETALTKFQSPDAYSRSTAHQGRRIEKVEGGWRLLNYAEYRAKLSVEERREYQRVKQAEYRKRKKAQPIKGSHGEREYERALGDGADPAQLDKIVTDNLPDGFREQSVTYRTNGQQKAPSCLD